jgi:hypothetical protein
MGGFQMENNNLKNENQANQVSQGNQANPGTPVTQGTRNDSSTKATQVNIKSRKIVYYILGVLEVLFAFRLVFKILGANPQSIFVDIIYSITNLFLAPFAGIFRMAVTQGIETQAVLEPTLIIAMIVYAAIGWGIVKLIEISGKQKDSVS